MWPVRIGDASLEDEDALRAWLARAASEPPRFYDLFVGRFGGLRFALGIGVAGGILESESESRWWWLQEGEPTQPEVEVPDDVGTLPVSGTEQVGLQRLVEVIVGYAREGARPAGRWVDERGRPEGQQPSPWEGPPPRPTGPATQALLQEIERLPRRPQAEREILQLMTHTRDDNLRAWAYGDQIISGGRAEIYFQRK